MMQHGRLSFFAFSSENVGGFGSVGTSKKPGFMFFLSVLFFPAFLKMDLCDGVFEEKLTHLYSMSGIPTLYQTSPRSILSLIPFLPFKSFVFLFFLRFDMYRRPAHHTPFSGKHRSRGMNRSFSSENLNSGSRST